MRSTLSALVIAAGLIGFGASAQAAPAAAPAGIATEVPAVQVQMRHERRMMRHRMERRMMRRHMERRMMHREMRHRMMRREMMHRM